MSDVDFHSLGFETKEMFDFPAIVNVEVLRGECPCRCRHCPLGIKDAESRKNFFGNKKINLKLFEKIVAELARHQNSSLRIHAVGEPLLWADLPKAVVLSKKKSVHSWIFTCAVTNDRELLKHLCANVDIIEVSINSIDEADYLKTKGINSFGAVKANIAAMSEYIKNQGLKTRLIVSRVQSLDQIVDQAFTEFWKSSGLVSDAFVRSFHNYNNIISNTLSLTGTGQASHESCLVHWARFNISVDGQAIVCFNELFRDKIEPTLILGDLKTQTIAEIWQGQKLNAIRRAELANNYSTLGLADALPCKNCTFCQPLKSGRQTSEHQIDELKKSKYEKDF
ncbi:MAG: radical SAM/SPASM domain-containing protein [Patescibacteria group bacterium]|jgi:pyruvate-formate lyase-activating enzyme